MKKAISIWGVGLALLVVVSGYGKGPELPGANPRYNINGKIGLSAAISLAETHIQSMVQSMEFLTMTEEVKSGDWERMHSLLKKFEQEQIPAVVWFALPDGSYSTVEKGKVKENLKRRSYFPKVMAGEMVVGDLVISKSTRKKVMIIAVPVKKEGKVSGVLGASVHLDKFSEILVEELQLPKEMVFYAIDAQGYVTLHRDPKWLFEGLDELWSKTLAKAVEEMLSKEEGEATYEFESVFNTVIFKKSPLTGWRFVLGVEK